MKQKIKYISIFSIILVVILLFFLFANDKEEVIENNNGNNGEYQIIDGNYESEENEALREQALIAVGKANKGDKEGALADYLRLLEEYPNDLLLLNNTAVLYSDMGQWNKSEEYYLRLLEAYPGFVQGYRMLAYLYQYRFDNGEEKALALIEDGLSKTNNNPDLIRWLIGYYTEIGDEEMRNYYLEMVGE
ncbi:MAG: hypothetical protein XD85_0109 [Parcubacteria bacterium 34_609]|nr:MAG: hypothetical protein XD85_0109 [Parcubacteria bacterium 34_609]KUK98546.1 MAG: hypothetical protein XE08_0515 [Parcubacteria bacterium 32_520]